MKRESKILLNKAIDSVLLSVEQFNRPWERGRKEAVLIFLDRAFELFLKAIILTKGVKIREKRAKQTIGFDQCVRKCVSDAKIKSITEEEAITIQIVNTLRDQAQHYILEVSEQQLYIYCQSALSLFDKLLRNVFKQKLLDYLPERVLPISSAPPVDFPELMEIEFEDIKKLLKPKSRKRLPARARLRSLATVETSLGGLRTQPDESDLNRIEKQIKENKKWTDIFPNIQRLRLSKETNALTVSLQITKHEGEPVHLVPEGTPGAMVVAIKRVDEFGFYSLGLYDLAQKIGITAPKCLALIRHHKLQDDKEFFKEIKVGSVILRRYSSKALDMLMKNKPTEEQFKSIWAQHKPTGKRKSSGVA